MGPSHRLARTQAEDSNGQRATGTSRDRLVDRRGILIIWDGSVGDA